MEIGIYITVRLGSTRLNKKALKHVEGVPIINYLISRVKQVNEGLADIVICTTTEQEDYELDSIAEKQSIKCFHGVQNNILQRHYDCAQYYHHKLILNVDGDDILCNPDYVREIIEYYNAIKGYDIIKTEGLPFGTNSMAYSIDILRRILQEKQNTKEIDTGWGELIKKCGNVKEKTLYAKGNEQLDVRLTLDYEEDFEVFKRIIEDLKLKDRYVEQEEIMEYLKGNSDIKKINNHLNEIYWENYNKKKI